MIENMVVYDYCVIHITKNASVLRRQSCMNQKRTICDFMVTQPHMATLYSDTTDIKNMPLKNLMAGQSWHKCKRKMCCLPKSC